MKPDLQEVRRTLFPADYPPPRTLRLADGRRLAWYDYGDSTGKPCIYITGTPASGLTGVIYDSAARAAGVRWISVDKPGYGHSDFQPRRRLLDWPKDIAELAEHLKLKRFAVAGESGGGPHALALAHAMPHRITVALVIAGMGPASEPWARQGMNSLNRSLLWLAGHFPSLLHLVMALLARSVKNPGAADRLIRQHLAAMPAADRAWVEDHPEVMKLQVDSMSAAFQQGARGAAQEVRMFTKAWEFRLADVKTPVVLWHGTEDANVPIAVARRVAADLPNCTARFVEGVAHALSLRHTAEIVDAVRSAS